MRVTDMRGIDLDTFRFHYDLTFCALLMNADGTTYSVYGGRTYEDAEDHLSVESLRLTLAAGLLRHKAHKAGPLPKVKPTRIPESLPFIASRLKKKNQCVHCHTVTDALHEERRAAGTFTREDLFEYPDPLQIGLRLKRDAVPPEVEEVFKGSAAERAGILKGSHLMRIGDSPLLLSFGDVTHALHALPREGGAIPFRITRGPSASPFPDPDVTVDVLLHEGWRTMTPAQFAWRPALWRLRPQPGFGGPELTAAEKRKHRVEPKDFAFRIKYLVTWGENANIGRSAHKAGLRKNDIVTGINGRKDFESVAHFHAWFRFTRKPGEVVKINVLRGRKKLSIDLPVLP